MKGSSSMTIEIVRGTSRRPAASKALADFISRQTSWSGLLFIGYPIISTSAGGYPIDALLVSPDKGIIVFDLIEGDIGDYGLRQDDSYNKLEARLKTHSELMWRRDLLISIYTISFAPAIANPSTYAKDGYPLANASSLVQELTEFTWSNSDEEVYKKALSAIQNISTIRKSRQPRKTKQKYSRGDKLRNLEGSISTLDPRQSRAVVETVDGVQRIRGLAGSGKTIVLALKAAYLHAYDPEWNIAVTFHTRSLKGHFERLINRFFFEQTGEDPDWEKLRIVSSWGAPGNRERDGIYYEFCRAHDIEYFDFKAARSRFEGREFAGACEHALGQVRGIEQLYDAILVDEAQDLSPAFLRLCYEFLKEPKRLVYAYDELQNLSGESLPSPEKIFGNNVDGLPKVRFDDANSNEPQRDIILDKCYRNSRPVLVTAHALGFGIYREAHPLRQTRLIQMFDHPQLWEEIGYRLQEGELRDGSFVALHRPEETSPKFLETHSNPDDLIQFILFGSEEEQADWLTAAIEKNIREDELMHDDIIVINPDPITTRNKVGPIRDRLLKKGINCHTAGVDTVPDIFFRPDFASVTFTGIYRAKGNEAGMVYIINAQDCHSELRNLASLRNRLFTAITRSKAWIRVLGVGAKMEALIKEYEELKRQSFELRFTYPTREQREQLRIVHRDMTTQEYKRLENSQKNLEALIEDIESGNVHLEDLDGKTLDKLRSIIMEGGDGHADS